MSGLLDLAAIRRDHPLPQIAGAVIKLVKRQNELAGCCPFHDDHSPSFTIFGDMTRFFCFGCGATGDVLEFVQRRHRLTDLRAAAELLCGGELPTVDVELTTPCAERDTVSLARSIWRNAGSIAGTPAEAYLRNRGITIDLPPTLRFARLRFERRESVPAMVAMVIGSDDRLCGIQRTFLTEDGRKAATREPKGKVKLSLGRVKGGAIRLAPAVATGLAVTEGIEDALSLLQLGAPSAWAAAGGGMLPSVKFPDTVRSLIIGGDADAAGRAAAFKAAAAFRASGHLVRIIYPSAPAKDFNEELAAAGKRTS